MIVEIAFTHALQTAVASPIPAGMPIRREARSRHPVQPSPRSAQARPRRRRAAPHFEATAVATLSPTTWVAWRRISRKSSKPSGGSRRWDGAAGHPWAFWAVARAALRSAKRAQAKGSESPRARAPRHARAPHKAVSHRWHAAIHVADVRAAELSSGRAAKLAAAASHCPGSNGTLAPPTLHHPAYAPPVF